MCLLLNKVDRLMIELRLPPKDAYHKMSNTISEVNAILEKCAYGTQIDPTKGNVCFSSSRFGFSFSIQSFANLYAEFYGGFDATEFSKRLWGDAYLWKNGKSLPKYKSKKGSAWSGKTAFIPKWSSIS